MPLYDYECSNKKCKHKFDQFVRISEFGKLVVCSKCGGRADKLLSLPNTHRDLAYNFVDVNTTGKPIQFSSKGQWKRHLKSLGLTDDIPQKAPNPGELKQLRSEKTKEERIADHKKVIEEVVMEGKRL